MSTDKILKPNIVGQVARSTLPDAYPKDAQFIRKNSWFGCYKTEDNRLMFFGELGGWRRTYEHDPVIYLRNNDFIEIVEG